MKKPWSVPYLVKKIWPFSGIAARAGLVAAAFVSLMLLPLEAHALVTVNSATLNGGSSVEVLPGATITAVVNVTTTQTGAPITARWRSTSWQIGTGGAVTCVDHPNHDGAGTYSETFSITAPATPGTYNAYFIGYNDNPCLANPSATLIMTGAVIVKNNQTITFGAQGAWTYAPGATFALSPLATASSGLAVTYSSQTTGVCTIAGTTVTIVTAGTCTIAADQAGDTNYYAAPQVTQDITIAKANQTITFGTAPAVVVGGTGTVSATGGASGNPVTFTSTTPAVCTATGTNGATITGITAGTCTIAANQAGNTNYNAATQVTQTFTVTTAGPAATTNAASNVTTLNNGASWSATLNGIVSSNGADTTVSFDYGLTTAYGTLVDATPSTVLGVTTSATAVSADLIGLACNTLFHYRVKATNGAGISYGLDGTFTTGPCAGAFAATDCAAARFGKDLGCTANDVNLTGITVAPGSVSSCVSGTPVTLDLDMTVNFATPDRWDVGIFIANDGKLPTLLPANGGANSCSVDILPITPPTYGYTFPDLDGAPMGTSDTCGDGNSSIDDRLLPSGTVPLGDGVKRMTGVTLPCYASPASGGKLFVPFVVSWDNQKSPIGGLCTSNQYPVPNTTSKCNAPLSSVAIEVVVLPKIIKTHSGATFNPGNPITYTITVFNDSGGTLQQSTLTDPAVTGLTVNSVACATANGSTCPGMTSAAMIAAMQDVTPTGGIAILPANLPNNSSLIFTVIGTLSPFGDIGQTISNTASITIGSHTNSSIDSVTLGAASASKSFSPTAITEGSNSLMTITFTNPTAFDVTDVSFTDTYPSGLVNAASPSTTCGGTVTEIAGGLTFAGGIIPASGSCTVSVYVTSATANNYINSVSFLPDSLGSASATLTVNVAVFGAFNACDVGTCVDPTTSDNTHITTKIAGLSFNLDIVALKNSPVGSWDTNYNSNVLVELLDAINNGPSDPRDIYSCPITSTVIATLNTQFKPGDNGLITVGSFSVPDAYRDVRVRVTNVGGTTKKGCSTDRFAIRPATFTLIAQDADAQTAGTTRTLNNVVVAVGPVHKAGQPFTFTATAYNAAVSPAPTINYVNNVGSPSMTLSACAGTACTASFGTFSPGVTSFTSGTLFSNVATYSEVGAFNLTLQDTDFAAVDAADTLATCAGRYVCSAATPVGRFVPDHFGLTGSVVNRSDLAVPGDTFTYMGEPMLLNLEVTAYNANDVETRNYAGNFAKLDATTLGTSSNWFNTGCASGTQCFGLGAINGTTTGLTGRLAIDTSVAIPTSSWAAGVGTFVAHITLSRPVTTTYDTTWGPYDTLNIGGAPHDGDGITLPGITSTDSAHRVDLDADVDATNERRQVATTKSRYGRVKISNAYGSELLDLSMTLAAQYWNGSAWIMNAADQSTTGITLSLSDPFLTDGLVPADLCAWDNGTGIGNSGLGCSTAGTSVKQFREPPQAIEGGNFNLNFRAPGTGNTGALDVTVTVPDYLKFNWSGTGNANPTARATFGVYKGNNQFIYLREMY